jgi:hypothetical protein
MGVSDLIKSPTSSSHSYIKSENHLGNSRYPSKNNRIIIQEKE